MKEKGGGVMVFLYCYDRKYIFVILILLFHVFNRIDF